ncbi:hypothetical protein BFP72_02190 [Reichenbachiella sp. 5M10]|uniref:RagB/SusD family nutrient uptake outer membrane protein n=1 Tax=Reichenbachiella sp. 5M10 TaxID=1889772 RepID=UPI000C15A268|nr:RagB/SusD family nutrient uptake outer membrane protein [Reichenbachiella sp. 5M10]PIB34319.1 hypothetical protein BFP72_02190 [Reichenbachiella sp. 5M10]
MKKIVTLIFLSVVGFYGCKEDFTTTPPKGSLGGDVLQNEEGVDLLLTATYGLLDGFISGDPWQASGDGWWLDASTDDANKGSHDNDQPDLQSFQMYRWTPSNSYFITKWLAVYGGVDRANSVINLANSIEGSDMTVKIAEARFLRAHFHFELQRLWANVSYISEDLQLDPDQPNSGPIWDQIAEDYQFAVDNLPPTQDTPGRATSWVAKAFLGKMYMQKGDYTTALPLLTDVIDNGPFGLIAEFKDNFTFASKNSKEAIFSIQFNIGGVANDANGNQAQALVHPSGGPYSSCCGFYTPTQDLANAYKTDAAGLPLLDTFNDSDINNDYGIESGDPFTPYAGNLDPRIDYTIGRRGIDFNGYGVNPGKDWAPEQPEAGPYLGKKGAYKFEEEADSKGAGNWGQQSSALNYNLMRYADLLLLAAECEIEVGSIAKAEEYVNLVRARARDMTYVKEVGGTADAATYVIDEYPVGTFAAQGAAYAQKAVRHERRLELGMEGHRYYDLRRYGSLIEVMEDFFVNEDRMYGNRFVDVTVEDKNYYLPIPLRAIDLSNGKITQSDDWK